MLFSFGSCSTLQRSMSNYIKASVDGKAFRTNAVTGKSVAGKITIGGSTTSGSNAITLVVPASIQPGTYKFTSSGNYTIQYKNKSHNLYASSSGDLVISLHDKGLKKLRGTFTFKGRDINSTSVDVTLGSFNVTYF